MEHENPDVSNSDLKESLRNGRTVENGLRNSSEEGRHVSKHCGRRLFSKENISLILSLLSFVCIIIVIVKLRDLQATLRPSDKCPSGWIGNEDSCYRFSEEQLNRTASQRNCSSEGASLVTLHSEQEQDFIKKNGRHIEYWIDLQRENEEQRWRWPNGSLVTQVQGAGLCGYLNGVAISSTTCDNIRHWICQEPAHH